MVGRMLVSLTGSRMIDAKPEGMPALEKFTVPL